MSNTPAEFNKYIVLTWQGREQATVFPFAMKHADVFGYMKRECPELEAISAGFFIVEGGEVWVTGNSESLNLASRPEDRQAIEALLKRNLQPIAWPMPPILSNDSAPASWSSRPCLIGRCAISCIHPNASAHGPPTSSAGPG